MRTALLREIRYCGTLRVRALGVLFYFLTGLATLFAQPIEVIIQDDIPVPPGGTAEVLVQITDGEGIDGFRLGISFDPQLATYVDSSASVTGTGAENFAAPAVNDLSAGRLIVSTASTQALGFGPASILRFQLRVSHTLSPGTRVPIAFTSETRFNDGQISHTANDGSLLVQDIRTLSFEAIDPLPLLGETEIGVRIDSVADLGSFVIAINYDDTVLQYVNGSATVEGTLTDTFTAPVVSTANPGQVLFSSSTETPLVGGTGTILRFRFRSLADPAPTEPTTIRFDDDETRLNEGAISLQFADAQIEFLQAVVLLSMPAAHPADAGEETDIYIRTSAITALDQFRIGIRYDASDLQVLPQGVDLDNTFISDFTNFGYEIIPSQGLIIVQASDPVPTAGEGPLVRLRFRPRGDANLGDVFPVRFDEDLIEINNGATSFDTLDGSIRIRDHFVVSIPERLPAPIGNEVTIPVSIDQAAGLRDLKIVLDFDGRSLFYVPGSPRPAEKLPGSFAAGGNLLQSGQLLIVLSGLEDLPPMTGEVLTFQMHLSGTAPEDSVWDLTFDQDLSTANNGAYGLRYEDGSLLAVQETEPCLGLLANLLGAADTPVDINRDEISDAADLIRCLNGD